MNLIIIKVNSYYKDIIYLYILLIIHVDNGFVNDWVGVS